MKSASNECVVGGSLQVLHVHVLLVAPLGASHMAQPGTDQHEGGIAVRETANHTSAAANLPIQSFNNVVGTAVNKDKCLEKLERLKEESGVKLTGKVKAYMAFGDWMDFWYQQFAKQTLRPTTQAAYETVIYLHVIPEVGKIPLNKLSQNDLQQFYARLKVSGRKIRTELYGDGLSDRMVRGCHAMCRKSLEKAVSEGLIRINPAIGCKLPPKKAKKKAGSTNVA